MGADKSALSFDDWLDEVERMEGSKLDGLIALVKAYRDYLRHLLMMPEVEGIEVLHIMTGEPCCRVPARLAALEHALMRQEKEQ